VTVPIGRDTAARRPGGLNRKRPLRLRMVKRLHEGPKSSCGSLLAEVS
jgi:hypothetical protein